MQHPRKVTMFLWDPTVFISCISSRNSRRWSLSEASAMENNGIRITRRLQFSSLFKGLILSSLLSLNHYQWDRNNQTCITSSSGLWWVVPVHLKVQKASTSTVFSHCQAMLKEGRQNWDGKTQKNPRSHPHSDVANEVWLESSNEMITN